MLSLLPNEHWNYTGRDLARGLGTALSVRHADAQLALCLPGLGSCLPIRSARAAIVMALRALALPPGAGVGVPLYCCPIVFKAIKAAGCEPRFIDIDPNTYCLSVSDLAAKSDSVEAVIAVHMFGNVSDMPRLRDAAPGKPFIEDCAQALGSRLEGRPAGSFGDIAAFSFHSGKYVSVGEGGAIYATDASLHGSSVGIRRRASHPGPPGGVRSRRHHVHTVVTPEQAVVGSDRRTAVGGLRRRESATRPNPRSWWRRFMRPTGQSDHSTPAAAGIVHRETAIQRRLLLAESGGGLWHVVFGNAGRLLQPASVPAARSHFRAM